jgi:hypothetical protein
MSWHFSRALVEAYSAGTCSDGGPSAPSSASAMQQTCWSHGKTMEACRHSRSGMTCAPSTDEIGVAVLTWCLGASLARTSAQPEKGQESEANAPACGDTWRGSLARYDQSSRSWKTAQCSLVEGLESFSATWPISGSMRNGACSERATLVPPISASGSGFWPTPLASAGTRGGTTFPTPTASDANSSGSAGYSTASGRHSGTTLTDAVVRLPTPTASRAGSNRGGAAGRSGPERLTLDGRASRGMFPTPTASDWKAPSSNPETQAGHGLAAAVGQRGQLSPTWVESYLMGWPLGWTACEPLETGRFLEWQRQHSSCCEPEADGRGAA